MGVTQVWENLRAKARLSEFEIHTVPQNKSIPLWFLVGVSDKHLVIKKAENHTPSIKISMDRAITYKDFEFVYRCNERWLKGDHSGRQEAIKKSQNTAYIYALIDEASKQKVLEQSKN
ncbi:hypothetical protein [Neobacillus sp. OS1-33]|uniref:hypothetical protein n=1 Tax=Neobacillus sp. OS1-33 TaxID=3070683 RepID=UPI0027DFC574|nr:hypothetical protein [Neobacillus sp. OS1-33]WML23808.1 hypothetical protein RCG22_12475 [Neobacillus sp. OS1-33]